MLIVDDHRVLLDSLSAMLGDCKGLEVVGTATTVEEAVAAADACRPDVVLMDFRLRGGKGTVASAAIIARQPGVAVVFLSADDSESAMLAAFEAGAAAYMRKTDAMGTVEEVVLRAAADDLPMPRDLLARLLQHQRQRAPAVPGRPRPELAPRELDALRLLVRGLDDREAAGMLGLSEPAARDLVGAVVAKMGCRTRLAAILRAHELRLVDGVE